MISVLIEMYTKSSRNCEEGELIFHIEQSWGQGGNGKSRGKPPRRRWKALFSSENSH